MLMSDVASDAEFHTEHHAELHHQAGVNLNNPESWPIYQMQWQVDSLDL